MIPGFNEDGYLPPGIHKCMLEELLSRFGHGGEEREACGQSLQWLMPMCRRAGIARLLIAGSFVTDRQVPGDVDCVLLPGDSFVADSDATLALRIGLPYLSLHIAETSTELDFFINRLFASDRFGREKGLVEVVI